MKLKAGETYDVKFSKTFVKDIDNAKMSENLTNVLFEKMDHQPDWFKLSFKHQEDGEDVEHVLYKDSYGMGKKCM